MDQRNDQSGTFAAACPKCGGHLPIALNRGYIAEITADGARIELDGEAIHECGAVSGGGINVVGGPRPVWEVDDLHVGAVHAPGCNVEHTDAGGCRARHFPPE